MDSSEISPSAVQKKEAEAKDSGSAESVKIGKNGASKEMGHSILNSVYKSTSQIKKPPRRRTSPLNWFPRKKTDSYLKRKIKLLQEVGGMNSSLDETLGDSNPHYSRVLREKIAAREAARKAMEARKAAMVEASWCRILQAARIPSKEAESQLAKAEESVAEAFEESAAKGVIMHHRPDCPRRPCDVETSSITEGGSTHTVAASFETAFEVDKEVAAAVKTAFIRLANCPNSSNKEDFRDLLWKISQNPDTHTSETNQEISELPSECESDTGSEHESDLNAVVFGSSSSDIANREMGLRKWKNRQLSIKNVAKSSKLSTGLIDMMLDRLKCLQEEELASLATIVATCGLNAVLEEESNKRHDFGTTSRDIPPFGCGSKRYSNISFMDIQVKKKQAETELPSLDKFLVKHVSRLEKEVQEAKNARKNHPAEGNGQPEERSDEQLISGSGLANATAGTSSETASDLGSILVRHTSRFEKEIEEAKKSQRAFEEAERFREVQHLQQDVENQSFKQSADVIKLVEGEQVDKENLDINKTSSTNITVQTGGMTTRLPPKKLMSRIERAKLEALEAFSACNENNSLDKILVKSMHRLEREKMQALASGKDHAISRDQKRGTEIPDLESLDKILVKHQSGLEKAKCAASQQSAHDVKHSEARREARERELREAWGGLSLGNSIRPHLSRLERDKAAWTSAEEEERRQATELV
eukprot:TRINITY_DN44336_c0_g1_i1.p1 TRINITY_DN44336_c0_g1~~TRINITY_DN44336_c0_g1_i1.p1  ORF type:complete len:705 (-),score=190.50 TRINITY_DN44336_c0_g1_i1:245-2359(-)